MNDMKHKIYISLLFCLFTLTALGQGTVSGTVTELFGNSKEACIGVNVTFQEQSEPYRDRYGDRFQR